jgi:APA family basic amino acid/polyamine antiporter
LRLPQPSCRWGSWRKRPFRAPAVYLFGTLSVLGCVVLFLFLPWQAKALFPAWSLAGLVFYYAYGYRRSHVGRGVTEVLELAEDAPAGLISDEVR